MTAEVDTPGSTSPACMFLDFPPHAFAHNVPAQEEANQDFLLQLLMTHIQEIERDERAEESALIANFIHPLSVRQKI